MLTSATIHSELGHRDGSNRSLGMVSGTLEIVPETLKISYSKFPASLVWLGNTAYKKSLAA